MQADFIIVGAGAAGCVLAERLSASGRRRVLLIEAGGAPSSPFVKMPAGFAKLFKSKLDWAYESAPQLHAGGRQIFTPRGKMLGGSANMNAQIHQWCDPADFDGWAEAGACGWEWNDVRHVFAEMENFQGANTGNARGTKGPLRVCQNANAHRSSRAFVAAAQSVIGTTGADYNGGAYEGAWIVQIAHDKGRRFSIYDAYLKPALRRPNLSVLKSAEAERIIFEDRRAVGVAARTRTGVRTLRARAGVILAAGAFGSPCLLMRSGIGPGAHLREQGVEVKLDAPDVGAMLQDHPIAPMIYSARRKDTYKSAESVGNLLRYLLLRRGPLASNACEAFAFARAAPDAPAIDVEILFCPFEWRSEGLEPPQTHAFTLAPAVVAPRSRGSVRLDGAAPRIDFGFFSDPGGHDRAALLAAFRLARRIAQRAPLAQEIISETAPGPDCVSDDELFAWVRQTLQTVYHPTSTCRMGSDARSVTTPELAVRGTERLWAADASVMPSVPRGHPQAVVAMIAHRGADFIAGA